MVASKQVGVNILQVQAHPIRRCAKVSLFHSADDRLVFGEAVMIGRRLWAFITQSSPYDSPAHRIDRVEHGKQQRIARSFGDGPVQPVVPALVLTPRFGRACSG